MKNRRVVKTGLKIAKQVWRTKQFINKSSQFVQKHSPGRKPKMDITICTPKPQGGDSWGDTHFAKCFATSLQQEGYLATVYYKSQWTTSRKHHADICLHIRGLNPFPPVPGAVNIMWIICHPEIVSIEECRKYDIILVASEIYAKKLAKQITAPVHVFPQATDHVRFAPAAADPALRTELLFVGNTRKQYRPFEYRPCVIWASELEKKFHLYGKGWKQYLPDSFITGEYYPNEELNTLYASADIVLNDHWQDMKEYGLISNRIFDVLATGSFLISDYVSGIDEMFKGSVPTYSNRQEFTQLIEHFSQHPNERAAMAQKGREIVLAEHTFDIRARNLKNIIADFLDNQ